MGIIGCLIVGVVAGALAGAIHSGPQPGGLTGMVIVGLVGAIVGATIAPAIGIGDIRMFFSPGTWLVALASAGCFLALFSAILGHEDERGRQPRSARG